MTYNWLLWQLQKLFDRLYDLTGMEIFWGIRCKIREKRCYRYWDATKECWYTRREWPE